MTAQSFVTSQVVPCKDNNLLLYSARAIFPLLLLLLLQRRRPRGAESGSDPARV